MAGVVHKQPMSKKRAHTRVVITTQQLAKCGLGGGPPGCRPAVASLAGACCARARYARAPAVRALRPALAEAPNLEAACRRPCFRPAPPLRSGPKSTRGRSRRQHPKPASSWSAPEARRGACATRVRTGRCPRKARCGLGPWLSAKISPSGMARRGGPRCATPGPSGPRNCAKFGSPHPKILHWLCGLLVVAAAAFGIWGTSLIHLGKTRST